MRPWLCHVLLTWQNSSPVACTILSFGNISLINHCIQKPTFEIHNVFLYVACLGGPVSAKDGQLFGSGFRNKIPLSGSLSICTACIGVHM